MSKKAIITLHSLVKKEAAKIKKFATKDEIESLNFGRLNPDNVQACIYGQMTGNCYSERANELIVKCAERVYSGALPNTTQRAVSYKEAKLSTLNGKPYNVSFRRDSYHSPIEVYISINQNHANKLKDLVNYLKGETKKLVIEN